DGARGDSRAGEPQEVVAVAGPPPAGRAVSAGPLRADRPAGGPGRGAGLGPRPALDAHGQGPGGERPAPRVPGGGVRPAPRGRRLLPAPPRGRGRRAGRRRGPQRPAVPLRGGRVISGLTRPPE